MSRNFHRADDYQWQETGGGLLICSDGSDPLFTVYNDGLREALVNAYYAGLTAGRQEGRATLQFELRKLLGVSP